MKRFPARRPDDLAYTMIEIIAVLLVIGILATVAVSRFLSAQQDLVAQADIAKAHLRFAQLKALNDDSASWG
ncbi:MAG: type II secretion system protein, partial [Syntrophales bacterium]|nr:type II secretion system protein [Syntrophales bacterium]